MKKERLDKVLVDLNLVLSRARAQSLIMAGKVLVNNLLIDKPGTKIDPESTVKLKESDFPYVSRGALKLKEAVEKLNRNVSDLICMDVGASTGGFTDYLLQNGVEKVYAIDVGYGQFDWKLRNDKRVILLERTNVRYLEEDRIKDKIDLVVIDTSFISLKIVIPSIQKFMNQNSEILALIKPQFEAGKGNVGKGGVVRDPLVHQKIIEDLKYFFTQIGLTCQAVVDSPILGPKGNKEFIISLKN